MNILIFLKRKITVCVILISLFVGENLYSQNKWIAFSQSVEIKTDKKLKFRLTGSVKVKNKGDITWASLWARVDNSNEEIGFFDNMGDRPVTSNKWATYTIDGYIDKHSEDLVFGGICSSNGTFYFDDFKLFIENMNTGELEEIEISNANFENTPKSLKLTGWSFRSDKISTNFKEGFAFDLVKDDAQKGYSLHIEGKNIKVDRESIIGTREGYTPQIGTLVSMLNNLSDRVERVVKNLNQKQIDHLHDEKANSIGALIMHLAAAEKIYQLYTFENRGFNEEEEKFWGPALNLDDAGRETYTNHDVEYYLKIYKEVRAVTLEELKKRDDDWLNKINPAYESNNHYYWFHVMEHQSSHLGQILFLKKRIPEELSIDLNKKKKID
ncbi:DinB family protein [Kordia jejudonensis]|uniref:DinB family protein n=1 Tax=Kordia jejudonensis TaxID=1348245 RepID=UPI0006290584|nr:DUF664 domain-containing protein [Kordia jejudonensis]